MVQWLNPGYSPSEKKGVEHSKSVQIWNLRLCWNKTDFKTTFLTTGPTPKVQLECLAGVFYKENGFLGGVAYWKDDPKSPSILSCWCGHGSSIAKLGEPPLPLNG